MNDSLTSGGSEQSVADWVRSQRESLGLSQEAVAEQLFLTTTFIRYLDAGEFDRFPKQAFVRGYLRSYARVIGLDGDAVVRQFDSEFRTEPQEAVAELSSSIKANRFSGPVVLSGMVGLVFVLLLVVLVWAFLPASEERQDPFAKQATSNPEQLIDGEPTMGGELTKSKGPTIAREPASDSEQNDDVSLSAPLAPQEQNALEESNAPVPVDQASVMEADLSALLDPTKEVATDSDAAQEPQVPQTTVSKTLVSESLDARGGSLSASTDSESQPIEERGANPEQGLGAPRDSTFAAIDEGRAVDQAASRRFQLGQGSLQAARVSVERTPIDGGRLIEVDAGGPDRLSAAFSAACWVEVEDANQTLIYGDLSRAGDVLAIQGEAPMTVLLGNAPAVVMSFNQRRIDLSPETTRDLTARVVLEN